MKRKSNLITICLILIFLLCFGVNVSAETNTTRTAITILTEKAEGKIYLTYSKKNVDGYQVRWAPNSKMTNAKSASSTKTELYRSGLIGGKTYYFQVRTYKKINGKKVYSNWSPMKSIKLKKLPPTTTITSLIANSSSSFTVKWTKKSGVKGYQIRYSTDSSFKMMKTASTSKNTHTRKDLAKGTYYVSVRSYNVAADGTKYYSRWSGMKSVTLQEDLQKIFKAVAGHYDALKLGGYWTDELTLNQDGSFTGRNQESPLVNNGKWNGVQYNALIYYTKYAGKFKVIKQLNQYTYELSLQNYQNLSLNDKPYVHNFALYKPEKESGFSWAKHIYLFLPGTPEKYLPEFAKICKVKKNVIAFDDYCFEGPAK